MRVGGGRGGPGVGFVIPRRGRGGCRGFFGRDSVRGQLACGVGGEGCGVVFGRIGGCSIWLTVSAGCEYVEFWNDKRCSSSITIGGGL